MNRLTWYKGSVLPYASLWHVNLRATALNRLVLEDFPRKYPSNKGTLRLLFNDSVNPLDIDAFANMLGEPNQAFRWSHFGNLTKSFHFLVYPYIRICMQCLVKGYHSALFSICLLDICPIHQSALISYCQCGRIFKPELSVSDLLHPNCCECGGLAYFSRQTCRQPLLPAKETEVFEPIVTWLNQISMLILPKFDSIDEERAEKKRWCNSAKQLCEAIGIVYPNIFIETEGKFWPMTTIYRSATLFTDSIAKKNQTLTGPPLENYWREYSPATWTYRAMSRYLRRHVVSSSQRWYELFTKTYDPIDIANILVSFPEAKLAFTEMIWASIVEPTVGERRWPDRITPDTPSGRYVGRLGLSGITPHRVASSDVSTYSISARNSWLEYQATGKLLLELWSQAFHQAHNSSQSGVADWRTKWRACADQFSWAAVPLEHNRFVFLSAVHYNVKLVPRPRMSKDERRVLYNNSKNEAFLHVCKSCEGLCLSWTALDGWHTEAGILPTTDDWKIHRLVGVAGIRPKAWLFQGQGRFVLRLVTTKLQVICDTPAEAFKTMRECVKQYQKMGWGDLTDTNKYQDIDSLISIRNSLKDEYQMRVKLEGLYRGFWKSAEMNHLMASNYWKMTHQKV